MPTYEYECEKCGHRFDVWQSASEAPLTKCMTKGCRGTVRKVFHPVGIIFKGSGWHITDYSRNGNGSKKKDAGTPTEKGEAKKEEGLSATKSDKED